MAVTVDAKCAADTQINSVAGTTGVTSTNLTVGATATALFAVLVFDGSATMTSPAMHWDATSTNVAMTQIGSTVTVSLVGQIMMFGLVNPVAGAKTLKATWVGTGVGYMASMSFIGTDTGSVATAFTNAVTATPTGATGTQNITGASGNYAICVNGNDDQTYTTFINATSSTLLFSDINNNYAAAAYAPEVGTTTTFSWAQAGSEQNVVAGCTVSAPAGTSTSVTGVGATGAAGSLARTTNTYGNRVRFSTTTTGTGTIAIGSATSLYQLPTVAEVISGTQVGYTIVDGNLWEVGTGIYTSSYTLSRATIESSSFGAGIPISLDGNAIVSFVVTAAMFTATAPLASPALTGTPTAPTASSGSNSTQVATTAFVAPTFNDVGSNKIHNPLFNVAQRGTGAFTTSGYTLDRWAASVTTDTISITQVALSDADRAAIGDEEAQYAFQNVFTGNSGTAYNEIYQRIEDVRRLSNKTVTVSFWAKAASGAPNLGVSIDQNLGSGGSPANVFGTGVAIALSTTWTRYSTTFIFGSLLGLGVGTGGDTSSQLNFWFSSGATQATRAGSIGVQSATIQLWGVQLEVSGFASLLEKPDPRHDLTNCQRFFQYHTAVLSAGYSGANTYTDFTYPVTMRAAPAATFDTTSYSNASTLTDLAEPSHIRFGIVITSAPGYGYCQTNVALSADL